MDKQEEIMGQFVRMIETIANSKMKKMDFGEGIILFRGEIHLIKALGDIPGMFISESPGILACPVQLFPKTF